MTRPLRIMPALTLLSVALLASAERAAGPLLPDAKGGMIQVTANSLRIQPGTSMNYLRFADGVQISGQGFSLRADTVEIDIATEGVLDTSAIKLPSLDEPPERVIADPAAAVQQMAREIRGPAANLDAASVKRIAASGGLRIDGPGISLSTGTLYSEDGGLSWSTGGRAELKLSDSKRKQSGSFSADLISFNTQSETLLARGRLSGSFTQDRQNAVTLEAGELRADLSRQQLEIRGGLELGYGGMTLRTAQQGDTAPPVRLNLDSMQVELDGGFVLSDSAQGLDLRGSGLSGSLNGAQEISVSRGAVLTDSLRGLELRAERLSAVLEPLRLEARGAVRLKYGKSSYDSEEAVVTREGEGKTAKYILEMSGPQTGRINIDELAGRAKDSQE